MGAMAKSGDSGIDNASEIIERFGGIRPMASKMDVPVTTVQGWKKRDVIPGSRRHEVLSAARDHDVDLTDLISGAANENAGQSVESGKKPEKAEWVSELTQPVNKGADNASATAPEAFLTKIREAQVKAVKHSTAITAVMIVVFAGFLALLLFPVKERVDYNGNEIARIKDDVNSVRGDIGEMRREQSFLESMSPANLRAQFEKIRQQAEQTQQRVRSFSRQADSMINAVIGADAGTLEERLAKVEQQLSVLGAPSEMTGFIEKLRALQQSAAGQEQLTSAISDLRAIMQSMQGGAGDDLGAALEKARSQSEALGATLEGVPQTDLKAAAYLMAFAQFRSSLNRSAPFAEDLAVLKEMVGKDDPELQAAIERLAPKAQEGVLTPAGLSGEFRAMAGDIVVASLKGEDVSLQEKARARFNNLLKVEKDGELLTGTDTQVIVANAQTLLDKGDVQGAISELNKLEGDAAQAAQPWITEAEMTLLAQELEARFGGKFESLANGANINTGQIMRLIRGVIPGSGGRVIKDEESGVIILQNSPSYPQPDLQ